MPELRLRRGVDRQLQNGHSVSTGKHNEVKMAAMTTVACTRDSAKTAGGRLIPSSMPPPNAAVHSNRDRSTS